MIISLNAHFLKFITPSLHNIWSNSLLIEYNQQSNDYTNSQNAEALSYELSIDLVRRTLKDRSQST